MKTIRMSDDKGKLINGYNCMSLIGKKHFEGGQMMGYYLYGVHNEGFPLLGKFDTEDKLNAELTRLINSKERFEKVRV